MGIGKVIDKAVGVFNPEAGLKRTFYREKAKQFEILNKGRKQKWMKSECQSILWQDF